MFSLPESPDNNSNSADKTRKDKDSESEWSVWAIANNSEAEYKAVVLTYKIRRHFALFNVKP